MLKDKKLRDADMAVGIILVLVCLYFIYDSLKMFGGEVAGESVIYYSSPGFPPLLVLGLILFSSVIIIIHGMKKGGDLKWISWKNVHSFFLDKATHRVLLVIGVISFYVLFLIGKMPYWLSTFIFLVLFMGLFKATKFYKIILISAVATAFVTLMFGKVVKIPLP